MHAGSLLGYSAKEVLTDEDKLVESLIKTHELYTPDGMPVVFDLQVEAEILGCELVWSDDTPPSVKTHPLEGEPIIPCRCKLPDKDKGRIPMILGAMRRMKEAVGEDTALYGLICGPFTLASHLRGNDIFMDMILDEDYVKRLLDYTAEAVIRMADLYIEAGMDIIAIVDPLVSQISPDHFDSLCHDSFTTVFTHIRQQGAISSFFVCGNATKQLEVMCKTSPDSLSIDENVDIIEGKKVTDQYGIAIGGNIPLTTLMLHGTQQENMKYVVNLLDNISHERLIIAPPVICLMTFQRKTQLGLHKRFGIRTPFVKWSRTTKAPHLTSRFNSPTTRISRSPWWKHLPLTLPPAQPALTCGVRL